MCRLQLGGLGLGVGGVQVAGLGSKVLQQSLNRALTTSRCYGNILGTCQSDPIRVYQRIYVGMNTYEQIYP